MTQPYLDIQHLNKQFGAFQALKGISLTIEPGEFICFLGPSGCGKTTLLRAIAGLDLPDNGEIWQGGAISPACRPKSAILASCFSPMLSSPT